MRPWSSHCGAMGSTPSWKRWNAGWSHSLAQWVKYPALSQLKLRSQLHLRSGLWPENSICHGAGKKKKERPQSATLPLESYTRNNPNVLPPNPQKDFSRKIA